MLFYILRKDNGNDLDPYTSLPFVVDELLSTSQFTQAYSLTETFIQKARTGDRAAPPPTATPLDIDVLLGVWENTARSLTVTDLYLSLIHI